MPLWKPRATVGLQLVVQAGAVVRPVNTNVIPNSFQIQRRSHSHAATCDGTIRGAAIAFDPDHVADGFISVTLSDVRGMEDLPRDKDQIRFLGYLDEFKRDDGPEGPVIHFKARDLSALLRAPAVLDPKAVSYYSDTLAEAIQRILSLSLGQLKTSDGRSLADVDTITIRQTDALLSASLSALVSGPHSKGPITMPKQKCSPWDAIEHVVGLTGRLVTMDGQEIVVRQPAEVYGEDGTPNEEPPAVAFIFGAEDDALVGTASGTLSDGEVDTLTHAGLGLSSAARPTLGARIPIVPAMAISRTRKLRSQRRGVACSAWDTSTRSTLYVEYPDARNLPTKVLPGQLTDAGAFRAAKMAAKNAEKGPSTSAEPKTRASKFEKAADRDVFYIRAGVHTVSELLSIASQIYKRRSRQELEGHISTHEIPDALLNLQNGDRISLHVSPNVERDLADRETEEEQIAYLVDRLDVDRPAAEALLQASKQPRQTLFYVKGVSISWSKDQKPEVGVEFINLLTVQSERGLPFNLSRAI